MHGSHSLHAISKGPSGSHPLPECYCETVTSPSLPFACRQWSKLAQYCRPNPFSASRLLLHNYELSSSEVMGIITCWRKSAYKHCPHLCCDVEHCQTNSNKNKSNFGNGLQCAHKAKLKKPLLSQLSLFPHSSMAWSRIYYKAIIWVCKMKPLWTATCRQPLNE